MFRASMLSFLICCLFVFWDFDPASAIEFQEILSFEVPGVGEIEKFDFGDVDFDGDPEILATDGTKLILYSAAADSIMFMGTLDTAAYRRILLADVNRDSVVDIIAAYVHAYDHHSDSAVAIDFYDGRLGYGRTRSFLPNPESPPMTWILYTGSYLNELDAIDINHDGHKELFICYCFWLWNGGPGPPAHLWTEYQYETSTFYFSYPDSPLWSKSIRLNKLTMIDHAAGDFLGANLLNDYNEDFGTEYYNSIGNIALFDTNGFDYSLFDAGVNGSCIDGANVVAYSVREVLKMECVGNIDPATEEPELIATLSFIYDCHEYPPYDPVVDTSLSELRMYRIIAPDSIEPVWNRETEFHEFHDYIFLPEFPGHFFAFRDGAFIKFDGPDGTELLATHELPGGKLSWAYPFADDNPHLVACDSNLITIYKPTATTDTDENGDTPPIPHTLALGRPYPNPFNVTQTIPIRVTPNSHLTVTVYDLLGRNVARVYSGIARQGEIKVTWQADNLPSGIYFIRASTDQETASVRSILLK